MKVIANSFAVAAGIFFLISLLDFLTLHETLTACLGFFIALGLLLTHMILVPMLSYAYMMLAIGLLAIGGFALSFGAALFAGEVFIPALLGITGILFLIGSAAVFLLNKINQTHRTEKP